MKLSVEIKSGLKRVPSLDEKNFQLVLENISRTLEKASAPLNFPPECFGNVELKITYAALLSLIVETVRWKESDSSVKTILKECKFPDPLIMKVLSLIGKERIPLQLSLKRIAANLPHIIDVTWKMNYVVKSSYSDIDGKMLYFIDFVVGCQTSNEDGTTGFTVQNVSIVCTVNQLQTMVASLRAATRRLEAIAD